LILNAYDLSTSIAINDGHGKFVLKSLPAEAQVSPVFGIEVHDFDVDGNLDIILGGNLYNVRPEVGRYDASFGLYLRGDGSGNFTPVPAKQSGIRVDGEVRDIITIKGVREEIILVSRNNDKIVTLKTLKK
jgi:hypothetical protein